MLSTNSLFGGSENPQALNMSLSTYKDSSVYYRAGDTSFKNLNPNFINISIKNQATVSEASQNSYIINGKFDEMIYLYTI